MGVMKEIDIDIRESVQTILDHLDIMSSDELQALMDRIGFELIDRDSENLFKLEMAEQEYLNGDLILQNGELSA
jgi:hypothetical protein